MPLILQSLLPPIAAAFAVQTITAIPSIAFRTDRFHDVSGSLTFLAAGAVSLYLPALRARAVTLSAWGGLFKAAAISCNWRQAALTGLVGVWVSRLTSYLFNRKGHGNDTRLESSEKSPYQLALAFFTKALQVSVTLTPVLLVNAVPKLALAAAPLVLFTDVLGLTLCAGGFAIETLANWKNGKSQAKAVSDDTVTSRLLSKSDQSNYLGEISLWTGIATVAAGVLAQEPVQIGMGFSSGIAGIFATTALSFISPALVATKLLSVSEMPLNETNRQSEYEDGKGTQ